VRDSSAGIGTLTFYNPQTKTFGGLGHAVCDVDTGEVLPLSTGEVVPARIYGVEKGVSGALFQHCQQQVHPVIVKAAGGAPPRPVWKLRVWQPCAVTM